MYRIRAIRSEEEYEAALARIDEIFHAEMGTAEGEELDELADLVESYEDKHYPIGLPDPISAIEFRMDQANLSKRDLIPYIGSSAKVAEVLSGKRDLTMSMARALHEHLGIPADVLLQRSGAEILRRLRLGEDSAWEFKQVEFSGDRPTSPRRDDWANEVVAFANATGGALLCGVCDDGDVQIMSRRQITNLDALLVEICTDSIKPPVRIRTDHRELAGGKSVLLVEVPQGDSLHEGPGGAYIRVGASKRLMTSDERMRLAQRRGQARFRWFDEQPVPGTGFRTLDEDLWKPFLSSAGAAEPEAALEKMGFLAHDEHGVRRATVAGLLLCSRAPQERLPNACITATCYRGKDRTTGQVDAQTITGPLNRQITEAVAFALRNMRVAAHKAPAREELPQYSEEALFETITNAVVHRDYSIDGTRIRLSMFGDRMEIQSPGALSNNLTVDDLAYRQSTRNEVLATALGRMSAGEIRGAGGRLYVMERRGDGIPIIQRETRALSGKPPHFELVGGSDLRVILPAAPQELAPARVVITVRHAGQPVADAGLLALFPNKTWKQAVTDASGQAVIGLHTGHLPISVFAAAEGFAAQVESEWIPAQGPLTLELHRLPGGGSVIFNEATGHVPGVTGRLNPIRDTHDRTYLYASNIAINQGRQQPVHFLLGEELRLTDANGREMFVRIVDIVGRSVLVEYRPVAEAGGRA
ncbi:MAG: putative DNA binding domain-containing protein [Caldilineaceae bacterium]|nr:putative DNA binding domain-containing protein [Caldilineaceae bacterium]